ncbi:MAG: sigma-70 family RNA polymerase sigma factor [Phycisphaerales bacterium]
MHATDTTRRQGAQIAPADPGVWLDEHGDVMYRYALLRLGAEDQAEDAVQEALLAAIGALNTFDGRSSIRTWLIGILRHKVLDQLRRRRREHPIAEDLAGVLDHRDEAFRADGQWKGRISPSEPGPEGRADRAELRRALVRRIAQLPEAMRETFCLRELDGLDSQSVCEILGITPTNLWTIIHRAKLRLREGLEEDGFGRGTEPGGRS